MLDPIFQTDTYRLAQKLLDVSALRHEAIAANIANVETPGFRRLEVSPDFAEELRACMQNGGRRDRIDALQPSLVQDANARSVRPDGNTVEIERELIAMTRNSIEHDFLGTLVSNNFKQLKLAITGRTAV